MKRHTETPWKTVSTKPIYNNRWLSLREDSVELPDGRTTIYGVVTCGARVGVLLFVDRETVLLVRQYQHDDHRRPSRIPDASRCRREPSPDYCRHGRMLSLGGNVPGGTNTARYPSAGVSAMKSTSR